MPDKRQAALVYALAIVNEIIDGTKDLIDGITEIKYKAIDSYDFLSENNRFVYDSIGFERVYGLYDNYDDLIGITPPLKSDEAAIIQVKKELFDELVSWGDKLKLLLI